MHSTARESHQTFLVLDGLRGVAAIAVVLFHAEPLLGFVPQSGYLAVDLFFGLSGFVLAYAYDAKFADGLSAWQFMRIRLIRLYPLFILGVLIDTATICVNLCFGQPTHFTPSRLFIAATLGMGFLPTPSVLTYNHILYPLNSPAWSLAFELFINAAFALAWPLLTTRVLAIVSALAAVMIAVTAIHGGSLDVGWGWGNWHGGVPRVLYSFAVGVLLLRLFRERSLRIPMGAVFPVVGMLVLLFLAPPKHLRALYDTFCVVLIFPILVVGGATARPVRLAGLYAFLGIASYAIYAIHDPLLSIVIQVVNAWSHPGSREVYVMAGMAFVVMIVFGAYWITLHYDVPVRNWLSTRATFTTQRRRG